MSKRLRKGSIILFLLLSIVATRVVLLFPLYISRTRVIEMNREFELLQRKLVEYNSFEDSLRGNLAFRNHLMSSASTVAELRLVRESQRSELSRMVDEFETRFPKPEKVTRRYKLLSGLRDLSDILLVCMAIPLLIFAFKRR